MCRTRKSPLLDMIQGREKIKELGFFDFEKIEMKSSILKHRG